MPESVQYDNDLIRAIDDEMGWVEKDGSSPSRTADELGYDCKAMGSGMAWRGREDGIWSHCVLFYRGIQTTLLAKSFKQLSRMYQKLRRRGDVGTEKENKARWNPYYHALWERRYRRWFCKAPEECYCQLCRRAAAEEP